MKPVQWVNLAPCQQILFCKYELIHVGLSSLRRGVGYDTNPFSRPIFVHPVASPTLLIPLPPHPCLWFTLDTQHLFYRCKSEENEGRADWKIWDRIQHALLLLWSTTPACSPLLHFPSLFICHLLSTSLSGPAKFQGNSDMLVEALAISTSDSRACNSGIIFALSRCHLQYWINRYAHRAGL